MWYEVCLLREDARVSLWLRAPRGGLGCGLLARRRGRRDVRRRGERRAFAVLEEQADVPERAVREERWGRAAALGEVHDLRERAHQGLLPGLEQVRLPLRLREEPSARLRVDDERGLCTRVAEEGRAEADH